MKLLLIFFLGAATLLWVSVFGYLLTLGSIVWLRRRAEGGEASCPEVAVIIPTLNDDNLIVPMLASLRRADYPRDRIAVIVVDGGSVDRTPELVQQEIARGEEIRLIRLNSTRGWLDQITYVLDRISQDIVVVAKADSKLEPACIRQLVNTLEKDPKTAVVGASVRPSTDLSEERIHWWFLNYLWWMEGEALSTACVSGVCFAFRRKLVSPLDPGARTDDIHVALTASARGYRVRICRTAGAVEVRVPQTASELVRFRRRRGRAYLSELKNFSLKADAPLGWRIKRLISLWHFLVTPKVVVLLTVSACLLLGSPFWPWPIVALGAFALPSLTALAASRSLAGGGFRWWRLPLALGRLVVLTVVSMLTLRPQELSQSPFGGKA